MDDFKLLHHLTTRIQLEEPDTMWTETELTNLKEDVAEYFQMIFDYLSPQENSKYVHFISFFNYFFLTK